MSGGLVTEAEKETLLTTIGDALYCGCMDSKSATHLYARMHRVSLARAEEAVTTAMGEAAVREAEFMLQWIAEREAVNDD